MECIAFGLAFGGEGWDATGLSERPKPVEKKTRGKGGGSPGEWNARVHHVDK